MPGVLRSATLLVAWGWAGLACGGVMSRGLLEIQHAAEDTAAAQRTLDILDSALREYAKHLPPGESPIRVILVKNYQEFAQYAGPYARPSVGGVAHGGNWMAVRKPADQPEGADFEGILRHELAHILLARNIPDENLPRWLNEGLAMVLSREYRWGSKYRVAEMYTTGRLLEYHQLVAAFELARGELGFGDVYAQSLSMTHFLGDHLGSGGLWGFVGTLKTEPFEQALMTHTGLTPEDFLGTWRDSLWQFTVITSVVSGFSIFQLMAILTIIAWLRRRWLEKRILTEWEYEDLGIAIFGPREDSTDQAWWIDELEYGPYEDDDDDDDYRR